MDPAGSHEYWMRRALIEAERAFEAKEVPVGALIVRGNRIIGRGFNQVETLQDPTAHAEMIAITAAAAFVESKWLNDAVLYVTKEPCSMCAGAIVHARIRTLVIGAMDPKTGACGSVMNIVGNPNLNHQPDVLTGILAEASSELLKSFFGQLRKQ